MSDNYLYGIIYCSVWFSTFGAIVSMVQDKNNLAIVNSFVNVGPDLNPNCLTECFEKC